MFDSEKLIAVGGTDDRKQALSSMWTLDVVHNPKATWHKVSCSLPIAANNMGLYQHKFGTLMMFGGWNEQLLNGIYLLRETRTGYTVRKMGPLMEHPDIFPVNGAHG